MSENPIEILLRQIRDAMADMRQEIASRLDHHARILQKLEVTTDQIALDVRQQGYRLTAIEHNTATSALTNAANNQRMDGFETRLTLIEKRLDLRDR